MRADLFSHVLNQLRGGEAQAELSDELDRLCQACEEAGKAGTLTLTVKVKPNGRSGQFIFADDIKAKAPIRAKGDTLLFQDADGNLTREDPKQIKIELKRAPEPARLQEGAR